LIDALYESNKCHQTSITVLTGNHQIYLSSKYPQNSGIGDYYCAGNDLSNFMRNVKTPKDMEAMADRGEQAILNLLRIKGRIDDLFFLGICRNKFGKFTNSIFLFINLIKFPKIISNF
jgi:hypothetical protein